MTWAAEEFAGAQLGDARLNHRWIKLTERLPTNPQPAFLAHVRIGAKRKGRIDSLIKPTTPNALEMGNGVGPAHRAHRSTDATTPRRAVPARHHRAGFQRAK